MTVAVVLQKELARLNWTAYKLTKETGLAYSTVHSIVNGKSEPQRDTLAKICRAIGVEVWRVEKEAEEQSK